MNLVYIFSGLGADERIFQKIDFKGYVPVFIKWIIPHENESIENYALRIIDQITTPLPTLLGVSFGGMVAVEVSKHIVTNKLLLISSVKTEKELPFYLRLSGKLNLHRLFPIWLMKSSNIITNWIFGTQSYHDRQLLKVILRDTDPVFLKWAINIIVNWKNNFLPERINHIHGTSDRLLPEHCTSADIKVKKGGHFMIFNRADEITHLIRAQL